MLGLDEKAFAPIPLSASSPGVEPVEDEVLNRERLAWTCASPVSLPANDANTEYLRRLLSF